MATVMQTSESSPASAQPSPTKQPSTTPPNQVSPEKGAKTNKKSPSTKGKSEKKASRAGVPNYSDDDITALLDIAEEVEPLGANHWSIVANRFGEWADANDRPKRDFESLRNKFDKLANAKKKTGDPSCPPAVRRAKHIARAIQNKCAAMTLDGSSDDESEEKEESSSPDDGTVNETEQERQTVGARKKKRKIGATGQAKSKPKTEQVLLDHIGTIAGHIGKLSDSITGSSGFAGNQKEELASMIRDEVRETLRPTDELLKKMNAFLDRMSS